jgi:hypothetical protein
LGGPRARRGRCSARGKLSDHRGQHSERCSGLSWRR